MEKTIREQIKDYAKANPSANNTEIRLKFDVSRQFVSQTLRESYSKEELDARIWTRLNANAATIKERLEAKKSYAEIGKELGMSASKVSKIVKSNPILLEVVKEHMDSDIERINKISLLWRDGSSIAELMESCGIGDTVASATSYLSKLRSRHGETMFPYRTNNQFDVHEKYEKYEKMKAEGLANEEICELLGYKNVASMRSSLSVVNRPKKEEKV